MKVEEQLMPRIINPGKLSSQKMDGLKLTQLMTLFILIITQPLIFQIKVFKHFKDFGIRKIQKIS